MKLAAGAHDARELLLERILGAGVDHPILHRGPWRKASVRSLQPNIPP